MIEQNLLSTIADIKQVLDQMQAKGFGVADHEDVLKSAGESVTI